MVEDKCESIDCIYYLSTSFNKEPCLSCVSNKLKDGLEPNYDKENEAPVGRTLKEAAKDVSDYEKKATKAWEEFPRETPKPDIYYREPDKKVEGAGTKADVGKLRTDLLPVDSLWAIVEVLTDGAEKYNDRNWEKGIDFGRVYAALFRHLMKWWNSQDIDPDSGALHLAHVATNALFLLHYALNRETYIKYDNRPKASEKKLI